MTLIKVTHANNNAVMYLAKALIAGYYYSDAHRCTHIVASGGAVFPAKESVDEIVRLLSASTDAQPPTGGATQ